MFLDVLRHFLHVLRDLLNVIEHGVDVLVVVVHEFVCFLGYGLEIGRALVKSARSSFHR